MKIDKIQLNIRDTLFVLVFFTCFIVDVNDNETSTV